MKFIQEKKDSENAIKYLKRAIELDEKDSIAKFYLAYQYQETGETEKSI